MYWYTVCANFGRTSFAVTETHSSKKCIIIVTCVKITGNIRCCIFSTRKLRLFLYNVRNASDCVTTTVLQFITDLSLTL